MPENLVAAVKALKDAAKETRPASRARRADKRSGITGMKQALLLITASILLSGCWFNNPEPGNHPELLNR